MYINQLNSFADVEERYNSVKPVVSENHPLEHDVRPIGARRRKWERIIKIDDNTYALSCGGMSDPVFHYGYGAQSGLPTLDEVAMLSPIVWRRNADGTETVTVRNGAGRWAANTTYSFLDRALPRTLRFRMSRVGRHSIFNLTTSTEHYLPKTRTVPQHFYAYWAKESNRSSWAKANLALYQVEPDNLSLVFKRTENGFISVGPEIVELVTRTRRNLTEKNPLRPQIAAFMSQVTAMYPLLRDQMSWSFLHEAAKNASEIAVANNMVERYGRATSAPFRASQPELVRDVLRDEEHPLRHALIVTGISELKDAYRDAERMLSSKDDDVSDPDAYITKYVKNRMSNWIDKLAGFVLNIKEPK